jgi:hypothetical protein
VVDALSGIGALRVLRVVSLMARGLGVGPKVFGDRDKLLVDVHFIAGLIELFKELELPTSEITIALGLGEDFLATIVDWGERVVV